MGLTLPYPNSPTNGDSGNADPIRANTQAIAQAIQSFDGTQIQAKTVGPGAIVDSINPIMRDAEIFSNFVVPGTNNTAVLWSLVSGLNGTMSGGVAYVNGMRVTVASIASKTFTASQDTYVDIDYLGNVAYPSVSNNAASPALTANSVRVAKVVTSGSAITSVITTGLDSLGNTIRPTGAVSAANIDFWSIQKGSTTLTPGTVATTDTLVGTADISSVPVGAEIEVVLDALFVGTGTEVNRTLKAVYNSVTYSSQYVGTWEANQTRTIRITKVSGQNSITYYTAKNNTSTLTLGDARCLWKRV